MNEPGSVSTKLVKSPKLLALCDSVATRPGHSLTGFGRVVFNLFSRWNVDLDIWAIGFDGYGYKDLPANWTLIPGGSQNWNSAERLGAFLRQLANGNYTHVFILMDPDAVSSHNFPAQLRQICREKKIRSLLYYPVDAPLQPPFEIISAVDVAVTFTDYGARQTERHLKYRAAAGGLQVLPHGIDGHFTPVTAGEREQSRREFQVQDKKGRPRPFLNPGDFLIVNVNKNEWRKDPLRTLEIVSELRRAGVPVKLVMRMLPTSMAWGVHLERAAEQLGLTLDKDWAHIGPVSEKHMRSLYGAADLAMTTSLGEGWGFMMTEALGCGTPVAVPRNTSLAEIGERVTRSCDRPAVTLLPLESGYVCGYDTRLRKRVDLHEAVLALKHYFDTGPHRIELPPDILKWLSWDRIAGEFLKLMNL